MIQSLREDQVIILKTKVHDAMRNVNWRGSREHIGHRGQRQ